MRIGLPHNFFFGNEAQPTRPLDSPFLTRMLLMVLEPNCRAALMPQTWWKPDKSRGSLRQSW